MRSLLPPGRRASVLLATAGALVASLATVVPVQAAAAAPSRSPAAVRSAVPLAAVDSAALPDPTARGGYTPVTIQETRLGLASLQEPNSAGLAPTAGTAQAPEDLQIRGALYYPGDRSQPSPLIVLVHGNHGSCDVAAPAGVTTPTCATYKRNEAGYAYLGENLATWGYTVFSLSQDQLMLRQDSAKGKGMHQRRMLIAATLDALGAATRPGGLPVDANTTIGTTLVGRLDMTRIGLMGHSRGGDAVSSFIDYNRIRTDGPRYPLRGVISLAPVDYERKAPYGVPYMTVLPFCDGDVSNLQGARMFERGQYIEGDDPFPHIQVSQLGAIHNWYNTVWYADGGADGQANNDAACGNSAPFATNNVHPNNLRLSGAANPQPIVNANDGLGSQDQDKTGNYVIDNRDTYNPAVNTKISGDPARMGDQEKLGLATMAAFFRRYVGGEGAFEPYMTGELSDTASHLQVPTTACPTSPSGVRIACSLRVSTSYVAPPSERVDLIRPEVQNPLGLNAQGGRLTGSGFVNPYLSGGGVSPRPATTAGGYDWCDPEPDDFAPAQLGKGSLPTAAKACPLPAASALGGQNATRENSPVNHSYGRQLALAWDTTSTANLTAQVPSASRDVSDLKALALATDVNFWDRRNPGADQRGDATKTGPDANPSWPNEGPTSYDPASTQQDFLIDVTDTAGHVATVHAGDPRWGNALRMSTGTNTPNTHVVLEQVRVPLSEFAAQGVDLTQVAQVQLRFGEAGTPRSGSIQLADVRFQEAATAAPLVLSDSTAPDAGPGTGAPATGPDPAAVLASYDNSPGNVELNDTVADPMSSSTWVVDDDRVQCPAANFTSVQQAVDFAAPWDTIVVCDGTYQERSTPVSGPGNPVATDALNGLTITKPLKIKGAGADKVTIEPDQSLDTLAGLKPYLRDGGGNVITVSRQSLGSTDTNEMFVDISGVTVTAGRTYAEAGIAFFGAAGRVSESVVGPMHVATTTAELTDEPHGWGIVKTGLVRGAGSGTVENEVTVSDSLVTGYQSGGILFDGARGPDDSADTTARTGIRQHGYVVDTVVRGTPNRVYPQTGVAITSGTNGFVRTSRISGNYFRPDPSKSVGVLLADAGTETAGALTVSGDVITGNGFAVYNADATRTALRQGAPVTVSGSYLGTAAPVVGGPADPSAGTEAVSGNDASGRATVTVTGRLSTLPANVPTQEGDVVDVAPTASLVDPASGLTLKVGQGVSPLVRARDDLAVRTATLLVDGRAVETATTAPYSFAWTPGPQDAGTKVALSAVVTDSSGQRTTTTPVSVAVSTVALTPTVAVEGVQRQRKAGKATLVLAVNTAGTVSLSGAGVKPTSATPAGASSVAVPVSLTKKLRKQLAKRGKVLVDVIVTFTSAGGGVASTATTVKVVRTKKR